MRHRKLVHKIVLLQKEPSLSIPEFSPVQGVHEQLAEASPGRERLFPLPLLLKLPRQGLWGPMVDAASAAAAAAGLRGVGGRPEAGDEPGPARPLVGPVPELAVLPVAPAEDLPGGGQGQGVPVPATGGGDLADGEASEGGDWRQGAVVVRVALPELPVGALAAGGDGAARLDHERAVQAADHLGPG